MEEQKPVLSPKAQEALRRALSAPERTICCGRCGTPLGSSHNIIPYAEQDEEDIRCRECWYLEHPEEEGGFNG